MFLLPYDLPGLSYDLLAFISCFYIPMCQNRGGLGIEVVSEKVSDYFTVRDGVSKIKGGRRCSRIQLSILQQSIDQLCASRLTVPNARSPHGADAENTSIR